MLAGRFGPEFIAVGAWHGLTSESTVNSLVMFGWASVLLVPVSIVYFALKGRTLAAVGILMGALITPLWLLCCKCGFFD